MDDIQRAIANATETYHDLNANIVDELAEVPSPLEFLRFVHKNRPFIVRNAATEWDAYAKWDADYLRKVTGNQHVQVAITPYGYVSCIWER